MEGACMAIDSVLFSDEKEKEVVQKLALLWWKILVRRPPRVILWCLSICSCSILPSIKRLFIIKLTQFRQMRWEDKTSHVWKVESTFGINLHQKGKIIYIEKKHKKKAEKFDGRMTLANSNCLICKVKYTRENVRIKVNKLCSTKWLKETNEWAESQQTKF